MANGVAHPHDRGAIEEQQQHQEQQEGESAGLPAGSEVEVLRHGFWWPAVVVEAVDASGRGVLRNAAPPEGDGLLWRASGLHHIRWGGRDPAMERVLCKQNVL